MGHTQPSSTDLAASSEALSSRRPSRYPPGGTPAQRGLGRGGSGTGMVFGTEVPRVQARLWDAGVWDSPCLRSQQRQHAREVMSQASEAGREQVGFDSLGLGPCGRPLLRDSRACHCSRGSQASLGDMRPCTHWVPAVGLHKTCSPIHRCICCLY